MKKPAGIITAFAHAFRGLGYFFSKERNGKVQLLVALLAIITSFVLSLSVIEWAIVLICIGAVLSLEMLNSALEKLCDLVQPDYHPLIKTCKDMAAGAVLWSSIISAIIGMLIFLPKLIAFIHGIMS